MSNVDHLLTIILVIKDRPTYTRRWMANANASLFPFKIYIADGGKDQNIEDHLSNKSNYPNLNYEYLRYSYDACLLDYYTKISDALNQVKTPYVILGDDDDFWGVEGIRESVRFLETHHDYAVCRGRNFTFKKNNTRPLKTRFQPHTIFDVAQASPSERVMRIYPVLGGTFYDVHRTPNYQKIFQKVVDINIHFMPMVETLISLMDATTGKIKRFDTPYLIRETDHGQSTSQAQNLFAMLLTGSAAKNLSEMCDCVAKEVAQKEDIQADTFSLKLQRDFLNYLAPTLSNQLYAYYNMSFGRVLNNFRTWLIHTCEKKYRTIGKCMRFLSRRLHTRKARLECKQYLKKHPNKKQIFEEITTFLDHYQS